MGYVTAHFGGELRHDPGRGSLVGRVDVTAVGAPAKVVHKIQRAVGTLKHRHVLRRPAVVHPEDAAIVQWTQQVVISLVYTHAYAG